MWSSSLTAALVCLVIAPGALAATSCPSYLGVHTLTDVDLFDGPPSEKASLIGDDDGWDLTPYKGSADRYYLVCRFSGTSETKAIELPAGVARCKLTRHVGLLGVACS